MQLWQHRLWINFLMRLWSIQEEKSELFPSLPGFIEEVKAYIQEGEQNPAPDLAEAQERELALQVEEWLFEQ